MKDGIASKVTQIQIKYRNTMLMLEKKMVVGALLQLFLIFVRKSWEDRLKQSRCLLDVKPSIKHDEKYDEDSKNSFQNESAGFSYLNSSYKSDCVNTN